MLIAEQMWPRRWAMVGLTLSMFSKAPLRHPPKSRSGWSPCGTQPKLSSDPQPHPSAYAERIKRLSPRPSQASVGLPGPPGLLVGSKHYSPLIKQIIRGCGSHKRKQLCTAGCEHVFRHPSQLARLTPVEFWMPGLSRMHTVSSIDCSPGTNCIQGTVTNS